MNEKINGKMWTKKTKALKGALVGFKRKGSKKEEKKTLKIRALVRFAWNKASSLKGHILKYKTKVVEKVLMFQGYKKPGYEY